MASRYYLAAALPGLDDPADPPPLTLAELAERVEGSTAAPLVRVLLLSDDLQQRDAHLSGALPSPDPAILTAAQVRGDEALPPELAPAPEPETRRRRPSDAVWSAFIRYAAREATRRGSDFLAGWVADEVALRNALAMARARTLGLDPDAHRVDPLAEPDAVGSAPTGGADAASDVAADPAIQAAVSAWAAAADPLDAVRTLIRWRWERIAERAPWFTFDDDETAALAARLLLAWRWRRTEARD